MFGAGPSNVNAPQLPAAAPPANRFPAATRNAERDQRALKAHGLWNNAPRDPAKLVRTAGRIESLPLAVLGSAAAAEALPEPADHSTTQPVRSERTPTQARARSLTPEPSVPSEPEPTAGTLATPVVGLSAAANENAEETEFAFEPDAAAPQPHPRSSQAPRPVSAPPARRPTPAPKASTREPVPATETPAPAPAHSHMAPRAPERAKRSLALPITLVCIALLVGLFFAGAHLGLWRSPLSPAAPAPTDEAQSKSETQVAPSVNAKPAPEPAAPVQPQAAPEPERAQAAAPQAAEPTAEPQAVAEAAEEPAKQTEAKAVPAQAEPKAPASPQQVLEQTRQARKELRQKQPAAAETRLRDLLTTNPDDANAQTLLTQALLVQRKGKDALFYAQQLVDKRPKNAIYRVLLGDALKLTGNPTAATEAFRAALELDPSNREAQRRLGIESESAPAADQPAEP